MFAPPFFGDPDAEVAIDLAVSVSPASRSTVGSTATLTSEAVTAVAVGGTGPYSYAWTKLSGGAITINSPAAATTTFTAASMGIGESRTAYFLCTVTDAATDTVTTVTVTVTFLRAAALSVSVANRSRSGTAGTLSTTYPASSVDVSGGVPPYSYAWVKVSGDAITITDETTTTPTFSATGLAYGESREARYELTVTDSVGTIGSDEADIALSRDTATTFSPVPGSVSGQSVTLSASNLVRWVYTKSGSSGASASLTSGFQGTSITFAQNTPGTATFTVTARSSDNTTVLGTWTITVTKS
ncbi:hypothetical protein [Croceicoccus sp. BE223]|uniref:hypothetical protein n=1 Tax=Croceicoccus sp. BE223 TaxID=2817716 RepID=UPI00285CD1AE|nr:hypothetical protein [Croceicoccus sp. BE223]MDR7101530.1 hypothetical protein [Croceicoccus sp. BE223]